MAKRAFVRAIPLLAVFFGLASICASGTVWSQNVRWKYYGFTAAKNPVTQLMVDFSREARELTKGRLDIQVYALGELPYQPSDAVSIASKGLVELANTEVSFIAGEVPVSPLASMPLMVDTKEEAYKAGRIFMPYLEKVIQEKHNARILWWYGWPPRKIVGQGQAPQTLADLKGKKIRFPGPIGSEFLLRLGMVPVNINPGDVPTALQRKSLDGTSGAYVYLQGTKWYEQCNWAYELDTGGVFNLTLINKDAYDKLPADVRKVLDELGSKYTTKGTELGYQLEDRAKANFEKFGITFVKPSRADFEQSREKIVPFWSEWAKAKGPGALEVLTQIRKAIGK